MKISSKRIDSCLILLIFTLFTVSAIRAETLNVGVITDVQSERMADLLVRTRKEIKNLISETDEIVFSPEHHKIASFDHKTTVDAIEGLFRDPDVDVILCLGPVASHLLAQREKYAKPAFAVHIINAKMLGLPLHDGTSGVENFCYIDMAIDIGRHIDRFQEISAFKNLHLVISSFMLEGIPRLTESLTSIAAERDVELTIVEADKNSIEKAFQQLDAAEAIYLAPLIDIAAEQRDQLIAHINSKKIPSMNMLGQQPVERGVFVSITTEFDTQKLARRIAINLQRLLAGENPASFQTGFPQSERLTINMQTAREIGIFPTWEQMTDAVLINEEPEVREKKISLTEVIHTALQRNLQLIAKRQELNSGEQKIERARAQLRPKLSAFGRQSVLDNDRAESILTPAQYSTIIGSDLQYVIYNEPARANIDIQKLFQAARKEEERALLLDIIRDAAIAYLNVLKAKTLQTIQHDNLEVTRTNLEIARLREQIGSSAPAEVYRWEIQMASSRQAIIDATARRKKAELALNQILSASQEEEFSTVDQDIFSEVFFLDYQRIAPYVDNANGYRSFRDFLVNETFFFAPEIQQLNRAVEASDRLYNSARRRYSQPTIALQGNFSRTIRETGVGDTKPAMPAPFNSVFRYPDKNDWSIGLNVSIPLYEGGDRKAAIKEAEASANKLAADKLQLMQKLELNTRTSLEDVRASFSSIKLSKTRSEYAAKVLQMVQNAYSQGLISILDLIDAQNAALIANEASANAIFAFLSDFIRVSRAVGTFEFILDQRSNECWYERLQEFYQNNPQVRIIKRKQYEKTPENVEPATMPIKEP